MHLQLNISFILFIFFKEQCGFTRHYFICIFLNGVSQQVFHCCPMVRLSRPKKTLILGGAPLKQTAKRFDFCTTQVWGVGKENLNEITEMCNAESDAGSFQPAGSHMCNLIFKSVLWSDFILTNIRSFIREGFEMALFYRNWKAWGTDEGCTERQWLNKKCEKVEHPKLSSQGGQNSHASPGYRLTSC